jgi:hypothetical protein
MDRVKEVAACVPKPDEKKFEKGLVCSLCGEPATHSVDGEPSCSTHIEQIYEHQIEDYTRKHLVDNEWRKA